MSRWIGIVLVLTAGCSSQVGRVAAEQSEASDRSPCAAPDAGDMTESGQPEAPAGLVVDHAETYPAHTPLDSTAHWVMSRPCAEGARVVSGDCYVINGLCDYVLGTQQSQGWACSTRNDSDAPCTVGLHMVCAF